MAAKSDLVRVEHMLEYGKMALVYCKGKSLPELLEDIVGQSHIIRCLEVVGEAAYQTSRQFQSRHSEIPWPLIIGMRHRLVHAYTDINMTIVWQTAVDWLPQLLPQLEGILDAAGSQGSND